MARPRVHIIASLGVAAFQLARTRRAIPAIAPLISGVFVDLDHLLDYAAYQLHPPRDGKLRFMLLLHGWEYLPLLAILERRVLQNRTSDGLLLGLAIHFAIDQISNRVQHPLTYSLLRRASMGFKGDLFGGPESEHAWLSHPPHRLWRFL